MNNEEKILQALKGIDEKTNALGRKVTVLGERFDGLERRMDGFEKRMNRIEAGVEDRVGYIDRKVGTVEKELAAVEMETELLQRSSDMHKRKTGDLTQSIRETDIRVAGQGALVNWMVYLHYGSMFMFCFGVVTFTVWEWVKWATG